MKIRHDLVLDCSSKKAERWKDEIRMALGHGPALKLMSDTGAGDDTVHGSVSIAFCDTRTLGEDVLLFNDGHTEVATAENIAAWWAEQGHKLDHITSNQAYGNTIVTVELYEEPRTVSSRLRDGSVKTIMQVPAASIPTEDHVRACLTNWKPA